MKNAKFLLIILSITLLIIVMLATIIITQKRKKVINHPKPTKAAAEQTPLQSTKSDQLANPKLIFTTYSNDPAYILTISKQEDLLNFLQKNGAYSDVCSIVQVGKKDCKKIIVTFTTDELQNPLFTYPNTAVGFTVKTRMNETAQAYTVVLSITPKSAYAQFSVFPQQELQYVFLRTLMQYKLKDDPSQEEKLIRIGDEILKINNKNEYYITLTKKATN